MSEDRIKLLYIAGADRSGSTLLHNLLGQADGCFGVGEIFQVWGRGLIANMLCGCRRPFRECPTWRAILTRAFGGADAVDADAMRRLSRAFGIRRLDRLLLPPLRRHTEARLGQYLEAVERLYRAVVQTSGARVVVDSSKTPFYGYLLTRLDAIDLHVVHLVRDARGTTHSWTRRKGFQPEGAQTIWMARKHPVKSAIQWNARNLLTERYVVPGASSTTRVRYESLVERPRETLRAILDAVGVPSALDFVDGRTVHVRRELHSVFGNLSRFESGELTLRVDERWRHEMRRGHRLAVTALTLPLLRRYGYDLRTTRPDGDDGPSGSGRASDNGGSTG